jgi:hypothetical protein
MSPLGFAGVTNIYAKYSSGQGKRLFASDFRVKQIETGLALLSIDLSPNERRGSSNEKSRLDIHELLNRLDDVVSIEMPEAWLKSIELAEEQLECRSFRAELRFKDGSFKSYDGKLVPQKHRAVFHVVR